MKKMKRKNNMRTICIALMLPVFAWAQEPKPQDELNAEIAVVKPYNPSISDAFKINKQPIIEDEGSSTKLNVNYDITTSPLDISFQLSPIKAPRIKRTQVDKLYKNNVRIGLGNQGTFLGEVMLNSERSREGAYGVHIYHLSSKANVPDVDESGYSTLAAAVYGKKFFTRYALVGDLSFTRDVVHYYGSGPEFVGATIENQQFMGFGGSAMLQANRSKDEVFFDKGQVAYSFLKDDYGMNEQLMSAVFEVSKGSGSGLVIGALETEFLTVAQSGSEQQYFTSEIGMKVNANKDKLNYTFGLKAASLIDVTASVNKLFFYPDIEVSYNVLQDYIIAYAGSNGGLRASSFGNMYEDNPFVNTSDSVRYSNERFGLFGGVKGRLSSVASYHFGMQYSKFEDYAFFGLPLANSPVDSSTRKFDVLYDNVNRFLFFGEVGVSLSKKLFVNGRLDVQAFTMDNLLKPYYQPNLKSTVMARYNIQEKIYLNTEWYYVGTRYFNTTHKLDGFVDGNLSVEYRYSNNLSIFVDANNLLGNNYDMWEGYLSQGFNILGGFTYKF